MKRRFFIVLLLIWIVSGYLTAEKKIRYSTKYNYRQTYNDCGPFSIKAVLIILNNKNIPIKAIKKKLKWRLNNNYTLPLGIERLLHQYDIAINKPQFVRMSDSDKLIELKRHLEMGHPVILLVGLGKYQHYITLLGYNKNEFYIYDSIHTMDTNNRIYTIDSNGDLPGNRNISNNTLVKMWGKGGMYGLYRYFGIVCEKHK